MDNAMNIPDPKLQHDDAGLLGAMILDGRGGGHPLMWNGVREWKNEDGHLWVHLDRTSAKAQSWLKKHSGLSSVICNALLAEETRPRAQVIENGLLVILRGVNLNPGEEPDDMISVRIWVDEQRIITLRAPKLLAVSDVRNQLENGTGPTSAIGGLVAIVENLSRRINPVVTNLDDLTDTVEEAMLEKPDNALRANLANIRRQAISLRRYIAPQREAISYLANTQIPWITPLHKSVIHECRDQATRFVEDLDSIRERASIVHEELAARMSEQMNRTMFLLSIVAGIFLPLGFITGLLGINVGGMPGVENPYAFSIVCAILVALGIIAVWAFRRMKLF
jgi:zinc transporter